MKPIKSVISANFITPEFLEACKEIAEYYLYDRLRDKRFCSSGDIGRRLRTENVKNI